MLAKPSWLWSTNWKKLLRGVKMYATTCWSVWSLDHISLILLVKQMAKSRSMPCQCHEGVVVHLLIGHLLIKGGKVKGCAMPMPWGMPLHSSLVTFYTCIYKQVYHMHRYKIYKMTRSLFTYSLLCIWVRQYICPKRSFGSKISCWPNNATPSLFGQENWLFAGDEAWALVDNVDW